MSPFFRRVDIGAFQVDAQQGDFHDPGEGCGQCAARSAQRPGAARLGIRRGGGGGVDEAMVERC